jgi:hypothetical protein
MFRLALVCEPSLVAVRPPRHHLRLRRGLCGYERLRLDGMLGRSASADKNYHLSTRTKSAAIFTLLNSRGKVLV